MACTAVPEVDLNGVGRRLGRRSYVSERIRSLDLCFNGRVLDQWRRGDQRAQLVPLLFSVLT